MEATVGQWECDRNRDFSSESIIFFEFCKNLKIYSIKPDTLTQDLLIVKMYYD